MHNINVEKVLAIVEEISRNLTKYQNFTMKPYRHTKMNNLAKKK